LRSCNSVDDVFDEMLVKDWLGGEDQGN